MSRDRDWLEYWDQRDYVGYHESYHKARMESLAKHEAEYRRLKAEREADEARDTPWQDEPPRQWNDNDVIDVEFEPVTQPNRARKFLVHKALDYASRHRQTRRNRRPPLLTDGRDRRP